MKTGSLADITRHDDERAAFEQTEVGALMAMALTTPRGMEGMRARAALVLHHASEFIPALVKASHVGIEAHYDVFPWMDAMVMAHAREHADLLKEAFLDGRCGISPEHLAFLGEDAVETIVEGIRRGSCWLGVQDSAVHAAQHVKSPKILGALLDVIRDTDDLHEHQGLGRALQAQLLGLSSRERHIADVTFGDLMEPEEKPPRFGMMDFTKPEEER